MLMVTWPPHFLRGILGIPQKYELGFHTCINTHMFHVTNLFSQSLLGLLLFSLVQIKNKMKAPLSLFMATQPFLFYVIFFILCNLIHALSFSCSFTFMLQCRSLCLLCKQNRSLFHQLSFFFLFAFMLHATCVDMITQMRG